MNLDGLYRMQGMLFSLMILGAFLKKKGIITDEGKRVIADLVIFVTLPCSIIESFEVELSMDILKSSAQALLADCRQSPAFAGFCYCWNRFSDIINIRRAVFFMMTKNADKNREQMMMFSMDDMVPQNHMLRLIDKAINWNFIYDLVEEKYCPDNGRPSKIGRAHV